MNDLGDDLLRRAHHDIVVVAGTLDIVRARGQGLLGDGQLGLLVLERVGVLEGALGEDICIRHRAGHGD